jgi:hypothetical protein
MLLLSAQNLHGGAFDLFCYAGYMTWAWERIPERKAM